MGLARSVRAALARASGVNTLPEPSEWSEAARSAFLAQLGKSLER